MSLVTTTGSEAKDAIQKGSIDLKEAYIKLKSEGESVPVRIIGTMDYVGYKAHGDFNKGIFDTPCLAPTGVECPFCVAKEHGGEAFDGFYAKDRFVFAFGELNSKQVKLIDVSKKQAKGLITQIEEYVEEIEEGSIAFNLTRTGNGSSTAYSLNVITPKKMKAVQEAYDSLDEEVVTVDFMADRLRPKTPDYMVHLLDEAGFPVDAHFDAELVAKAREEKGGGGVRKVKHFDKEGVVMLKHLRIKKISKRYIVREAFHGHYTEVVVHGHPIDGSFEDVCQFFRDNPEYPLGALIQSLTFGQKIVLERGQLNVVRD